MKKLDLQPKYGRKKGKNIHTKKEISQKYISNNIYATLSKEEKKQEIWSMDFTEEKIQGKTIYTCGIISINGKCLVGRITGEKNNSETAISTVKKAIARYGKPYMILTDRGSPFVSERFKDMMKDYEIIHSMSRPHTPVDNRYIETYWKSMKIEIGKIKHLNLEEYMQVMDFYEYYYNFIRPHSSLGYYTPIEKKIQTVI